MTRFSSFFVQVSKNRVWNRYPTSSQSCGSFLWIPWQIEFCFAGQSRLVLSTRMRKRTLSWGPPLQMPPLGMTKAEWIGAHATPRSTLVIQRWLEHNAKTKAHVMLDYAVPLKGGAFVRTKVVNWPKVFFVDSISPCEGTEPKEKLLEFLAQHQVPWGTESKFNNTIAFFDHAVKQIKKQSSCEHASSSIALEDFLQHPAFRFTLAEPDPANRCAIANRVQKT